MPETQELKATLVGKEALVARLQAMPGKLRAALTSGINNLLARMQTIVKSQRLQGGNPLHTRSGNLASSILFDVEQRPDGVRGRLYSNDSVGRVREYNRPHEYGGFFARKITVAWGRPVKNPRQVTVMYPERSYLRSTLRENTAQFQDTVRGAVRAAIQ